MIYNRRKMLWMALLLACAASLSAWACSVPVFRYALESWPPDVYEMVIFRRGPFSAKDQEAINVLKQGSDRDDADPCIYYMSVDVAEEIPEQFKKMWKGVEGQPLPVMVVKFPAYTQIEEPFWSGPLHSDLVEALLISPVRGEIARRILAGDSSVFVFVGGEDSKENDEFAKKLEDLLKTMQQNLILPEQEPDVYELPEDDLTNNVLPKLQLAFSVIRMSRTEPDEKILQAMLNVFEKMVKPPDEKKVGPMVYAFFGQGRALGPFFKDDINEDNLYNLCSFLIGPCSCTVKGMNPGIDVLMNVDWEGLLTGRLVVDEELPPLSGSMDLVVDKALTKEIKLSEEPPDTSTFGDLKRNIILVGFLLVIVLLVVTLAMKKRM